MTHKVTGRHSSRGKVKLGWGDLAYRRTEGDGPALILIHPLALAAEIWSPISDELAPGRDIIAVDVRAHGESGWDGKPFTIEDLADDILSLLDRLGLAQIDLLGMSMGGGIAMTLAARHPGRVRRLVLCDTTAWYGPDAPSAWEERALSAEQKPRAELIPFQVQRWFTDEFRQNHSELVQHAVDIFLKTKPASHAQACRAMGAFDARPIVANIKADTIVLTGEEDYATPPQMGKALSDGIPNSGFRVWKDARHFSILESPELRSFILKALAN